jgi:glutathione peroxidase
MRSWHGLLLLVIAIWGTVAPAQEKEGSMKTIYDFKMKDIEGKDVSLAEFKGKVVMIVNVASRCGFTPQYAGLQKLYETYGDRGFVILGFPANNFLGQEPGSEEEIMSFCSLNYGVTFPMFSKISVKGSKMDPLYKFLTDKKEHPEFGGAITWNFNKFLIGRDGRAIARFGSKETPDSPAIAKAIEAALGGQ